MINIERPAARWFLCIAIFACAFVVTHLPPGLPQKPQRFDKVFHFIAFTALSMVALWTVAQPGRLLPNAKIFLCYLAVIFYGAVDEITQPIMGHQCEFLDWTADAGGAVVGMTIIAMLHRHSLQEA